MKLTVKEAIIDILKKENITHVFGHTGSHVFKFCKAVEDAGLNFILGRQEGNASYMASGYAHITKKPSILVATLGPGVTNMVTGAATAYMDSIPLILIGGTVDAGESGRNSMQESSGRGRSPEQRLIFKEVCKQAMFVPSPEATPNVFREAFRIANSGRKGPVYIDIPDEYWDAEIEYESLMPSKYQSNILSDCNVELAQELITEFYKAKHPLIILGEGADQTGIKELFTSFVEKVKVPFTVTPLAKNFVDEFSEYYLEAIRGSGKTQKAYEYMKNSDLILFLGSRMHDPEMGWDNKSLVENKKLIQVDIDEEEIGRVYPIDMSVVGSIVSFLKLFPDKEHKNSLNLLEEKKALFRKYPRLVECSDDNGVNPMTICNIVEQESDDDAIFVTDTGWVKAATILKVRTKLTQSFIVSDKNGTMGYSIPASMGANLASNRETICLVGDGGSQMSINELGVLLNTNIKVIFIVFNNGGCACMFGTGQKTTAFTNPDFIKLADAYGMNGYFVNDNQGFKRALISAKESKKSSIIEVITDQNAMIWE